MWDSRKLWWINSISFSLLLLILGQWGLGIVPAYAVDRYFIKRLSLPASKIDGLEWYQDEVEIQQKKVGDQVIYYVVLEGRYSKPKFDLYALDQPIARAEVSGAFSIKVACKLKPVLLPLRAVGPSGVVETETELLVKHLRRRPS